MIKIANYFFSKIIPAVIVLLVTRLLYLKMDSDTFVEYGLHITSAMFISNILSLWLTQSTLRYYHSNIEGNINNINESYNKLIFHIFSFLFFISLMANSEWVITVFLSLAMTLFSNTSALYQSKLDSIKVLKLESLRASFLLLSVVVTTYFFDSIDVIYIIYCFAFSYLFAFIYSCNNKYDLFFKFNNYSFFKDVEIKKVAKFGLPLAIWGGAAACYPVVERYLIESRFPPQIAADYYAISELYYRGVGLLFVPVLMYIHPLLMKEYENNSGKFFKVLRNGFVFHFISLLLVGLLGVTILPMFFSYYFPGIDHGLVERSYYFCLIPFIWQLCFLAHKGLEVLNRTDLMVYSLLFCLLLNVSGLYFFMNTNNVFSTVFIQVISLLIYAIITVFIYFKLAREEKYENY